MLLKAPPLAWIEAVPVSKPGTKNLKRPNMEAMTIGVSKETPPSVDLATNSRPPWPSAQKTKISPALLVSASAPSLLSTVWTSLIWMGLCQAPSEWPRRARYTPSNSFHVTRLAAAAGVRPRAHEERGARRLAGEIVPGEVDIVLGRGPVGGGA